MQSFHYGVDVLSRFLFIIAITYYLATTLQWYNYSFYRIIAKHHKFAWHVYYFFVPVVCFVVFYPFYDGLLFYLYCFFIMLPLSFLWYQQRDKKLVWTRRVVRLFLCIIVLFIACEIIVTKTIDYGVPQHLFLFVPLVLGMLCSMFYEAMAFRIYAMRARRKLLNMSNLTIIAITGSYGKTSIKNLIYQLIKNDFQAYATPRSVNTYKGLVADINTCLPKDTQVYIAEAGARNRGDIEQISHLLCQHYGVISKIGKAHIEYFKNIETTVQTKFELCYSPRLKKIFVQKDNPIPVLKKKTFSLVPLRFGRESTSQCHVENRISYPCEIRNQTSTLDGISFEMRIDSDWVFFETSLLGRFTIDNIIVAVLLARELGIAIPKIQHYVKNLVPVPHRLCKIVTPHKIILDDSFNGNFEGMSEAIALASLHKGRKVIVTPGLVEYDEASNIALCKQIDNVFDIAIITGSLNAELFDSHICNTDKIFIKDKSLLESVLARTGANGDLVLFANDAPNYI
ncbi:UDP-N-acetylmuramoyl-tripeptide--D-alanyl-D-alanine ligase [Helicobacter aurati]|uniref:UDP-N-acetylmuramoyl-tripeptide--D-alanyl-D-alanine ligase n=1 Tax=Helicobacter aurati TaxID=137778 RepID=A0A3D8J754_9HELI|nr:UDP-N-acetylmuramoyl-tripeptide--D-alanyl-D-alanine ligase [Helicobacter aurati]RDU72946.1 UDP-N-acetylmuramoyl-tripeptide--D-alanyl-D-alanine ligase [Helicobacter aurati]